MSLECNVGGTSDRIEHMPNVIVTGSSGFLGSHLVSHYLDAGWNVYGIDSFISSSPDSHHHRELVKHTRYHFKEADICDPRSYEFNIPKSVDLILNFACPASPPIYQSSPVYTMMTCTLGLKNMLDLALTHGAILVHASTSEVYGDPDRSPQDENYWGNVNPYGIRSCYDSGKRAGEALCHDYLHGHGVDARLVRIFNTFGQNMSPSDGRVVTNFLRQIGNDEDITIYGDGTQSRSFCYVDDLIRGIVALAELKENPDGPVNVGNPDEFNMYELVHHLRDLFPHSKSVSIKKPLPQDDPLQRCPDISRAKKILGWEPMVSLRVGLECMALDWFEQGIIEHKPVIAGGTLVEA